MCGLVGVASTEGMKNRGARLQYMKMGLDIDSWRGWESTGMAMVTEASKEAPVIYKRALNGRDFIQLNQVEKYLNDIEKYSVVLGHNRAATTGRGNIVDHNAHPFQYGDITLAHNGHIRNTHSLKGATQGAGCLVDSAHVAFSMNANGEKETLEQIEGGFVFVWWNSKTSILNIARNTERPLHFAFAEKENTFYWASEHTALLHLMKDIKIDEDLGILYPKAMNWYQFNLKDLREFTKVPFVKSQGWRTTTQGTHSNHSGPYHGGITGVGDSGMTEEELAAWEAYDELGTNSTTSTDPTTKDQTSDAEEIDEIRQTVSNQRLKDAKQSGIPTSKKRQERAKVELRKLGIDYNSLRNCTPLQWCKYKNQNNLGSVLAKTRKDNHLVEVLQVRFETWLDYRNCGNLLVDCINVRNGPNNDIRVIGVVSPRMGAYLERSKSADARAAEGAGIVPNQETTGSTDRLYDGPDGIKVSLDRFLELSKDGCANCKCSINSRHHGAITWVGRPPRAVCPTCGSDPAVMELLGVSDEYRRQLVH